MSHGSQMQELPGFFDAMNIVRRHGVVIVLVTVVCVMAAFAYRSFTPDIYESSTRILVVRKGATLPGPSSDASARFEGPIEEDLLATHMLVLKSPRVVEQALVREDLMGLPSIQAALEEDQDEIEYVIENLRVSRGGEGQGRLAHVITLRFRHTSDEDCSAILSAVVASYHEFIEERLAALGDDALQLLAEEKQQITVSLESSLNDYQTFRENTPLIFKGAEHLNVHQTRIEQLETALAEVRLRRVEIESRAATAKAMLKGAGKEDSFPFERLAILEQHHFDSPAFTPVGTSDQSAPLLASGRPELTETAKAEFNQLQTMRLEEGALLEEYGRHHPLVRQKRRNIEQMEEFLDRKRRQLELSFLQLLQSDLVDLQRREAEIRKMLQEERDSAKALVRAELQDEAMRKEIDRQQRDLESAMARLDEIHLARNYGGFASEVIAPVKLGEQVSPGFGITIGIGGVIGLFLGLGLAVVLEYLPVASRMSGKSRPTIHTAPDVSATLPATV